MDAQQPPQTRSSALLKIVHWDKLFESDTPPRLGIEVRKRLPYTALSAFTVGMAIGSSHGSKIAAYRFRAENAHRFPTTSTGWFQYHKTKNYIAIVGGVKEGMKMGFKLGAGALLFCLFEETVDYARHDKRDFLSTVTAGLSFSGIYSLLARHDVYTAARTTKLGLKLSLAYGLMQDALESLKGNRPAYVDFILVALPRIDDYQLDESFSLWYVHGTRSFSRPAVLEILSSRLRFLANTAPGTPSIWKNLHS